MFKRALITLLLVIGFASCVTTHKNNPTPPPPAPAPPVPLPAPVTPPAPPVTPPVPQPPAPTPPPAPVPPTPSPSPSPSPPPTPVPPLPSPPPMPSPPPAPLASTTPAQHLDYYVANQVTGASDSNDGLSPTMGSSGHGPWKTVTKGAQKAVAGDIVHIYNGTYSETANVWNSGLAGKPICFCAAPGNNPVITSFRLYGNSYVTITGLTIVGPNTLPSNWKDMPATIVDDPTVGIINPSQAWSARQPLINKKFSTFESILNAFQGPNYSIFTGGIWFLRLVIFL
jgi:hypothetical protein